MLLILIKQHPQKNYQKKKQIEFQMSHKWVIDLLLTYLLIK